MSDANNNKRLILFSALIRWGLGLLFVSLGWVSYKDGAWPVIVFGIIIFVTGFFKPKRCLKEGC